LIDVRPERPDDRAAVAAVVRDAFRAHGPAVVAFVDALRRSQGYVPELALVAVDDSGVVGYVMVSWVPLEGSARDRILNLTPLAVRPDRQREGVGSRLVTSALALADEAGEPAVVVEGVPGYYPRFGFERASALGFRPPHDRIPDAAFMVKRLAAWDPAIAGRVVYPPEFDVLDAEPH
jgi:putative acetyltransferase